MQVLKRTDFQLGFWKRAAFIYRHGTEKDIDKLNDLIDERGGGELAGVKQLKDNYQQITKIWKPVYAREARRMQQRFQFAAQAGRG